MGDLVFSGVVKGNDYRITHILTSGGRILFDCSFKIDSGILSWDVENDIRGLVLDSLWEVVSVWGVGEGKLLVYVDTNISRDIICDINQRFVELLAYRWLSHYKRGGSSKSFITSSTSVPHISFSLSSLFGFFSFSEEYVSESVGGKVWSG